MSNVRTASALAAAFAARFPNAGQPGVIPSLAASGEPDGKLDLGFCKYEPEQPTSGTLASVEAMGVRGFASVSGKLQYVRATQNFHFNFELIPEGDFIELPEMDAKRLVAAGRAELATDEDVAAAQASAKKGSK